MLHGTSNNTAWCGGLGTFMGILLPRWSVALIQLRFLLEQGTSIMEIVFTKHEEELHGNLQVLTNGSEP